MTLLPTETRPLEFLVIEDDEDHAELILHILHAHSAGHRALHIADGQQAREHLQGLRKAHSGSWPDLVLLDLKLPRVEGLQLLSEMKEDRLLRTIPVVVLTTSDAESDRARAYSHHANSYIVKPVSFERFEKMVQSLCEYWGAWNYGK